MRSNTVAPRRSAARGFRLLALAGLALLGPVAPAWAALQVLAAFDNNGQGGPPADVWKGESVLSGYAHWINLFAVNFSTDTALTSPPGQPFLLRQPIMSEFTLIKPIDRSTPQFLKSTAENTHLTKVEIVVVDFTSQSTRLICRYVFGDAVVLSQSPSADGPLDASSETIAVHFRTLEVTQFGFHPVTGEPDPTRTVTRSYDQQVP